jgi:hypothetical protein
MNGPSTTLAGSAADASRNQDARPIAAPDGRGDPEAPTEARAQAPDFQAMCLELLDDDIRATLALVKCLVVAGITRSAVPDIKEAIDSVIAAARLLKVCVECAGASAAPLVGVTSDRPSNPF